MKTRESTIRVSYDTILYTELVRKTAVYHLSGGKQIESTSIRSTFSEAMQELLRDSRFLLCCSNRVIILHYIAELTGDTIIFKNGTQHVITVCESNHSAISECRIHSNIMKKRKCLERKPF